MYFKREQRVCKFVFFVFKRVLVVRYRVAQIFGAKRADCTIGPERLIGYTEKRFVCDKVQYRAYAEDYRTAYYLFGGGSHFHKLVKLEFEFSKRALERRACKRCDSVGHLADSFDMRKYLAYAFDSFVYVEFLAVRNKTLDSCFACVQSVNLRDYFIYNIVEQFNLAFDDQRVEFVERVGNLDNLSIVVEFGCFNRTCGKNFCKCRYRINFVVADKLDRFNNVSDSRDYVVEFESERRIDELDYFCVFVQRGYLGINGGENFVLEREFVGYRFERVNHLIDRYFFIDCGCFHGAVRKQS